MNAADLFRPLQNEAFTAACCTLLFAAVGATGDVTKAVAVLHPTAQQEAAGTVTLEKAGDGVMVHVDLKNLEPGKHGFHVHQFGDCSGAEGKSAGGHFAPEKSMHGSPDDEKRHVGDLGNITADKEGNASATFRDNRIALNGRHSVIGRAFIVHKQADDFTSQPSGDAGARQACGVIGIAETD